VPKLFVKPRGIQTDVALLQADFGAVAEQGTVVGGDGHGDPCQVAGLQQVGEESQGQDLVPVRPPGVGVGEHMLEPGRDLPSVVGQRRPRRQAPEPAGHRLGQARQGTHPSGEDVGCVQSCFQMGGECFSGGVSAGGAFRQDGG
jgi:hypothetical protein